MSACSIPGLRTLGGGAILTGLVLAAIGAFIIDKKFVNAAAFALAGAVLTFFGFMHGEAVGIAVTPTVAVAYAHRCGIPICAEPLSGAGAGADRPG